jgi:hypothetical protein
MRLFLDKACARVGTRFDRPPSIMAQDETFGAYFLAALAVFNDAAAEAEQRLGLAESHTTPSHA